MTDENNTDEEKKGFLARRSKGARRYIVRRFGNRFLEEGYRTLKNNMAGARHAMSPRKLDPDELREGFNGRYDDGGFARFAQVMREQKTGERDLIIMARKQKRNMIIMLIAGLVFFLLGAWTMVTAKQGQDILFGFSTSFMAFIFGLLAMRHDFSRWQIEERRFGGFREYLNGGSRAPAVRTTGTAMAKALPGTLSKTVTTKNMQESQGRLK